ncbi:flippase [Lactobacillus johnsonii]|uniref:oligosaccharide flippase family protein n=1 Tax=Lactobacillus johnsonii TaxID=33959 RepID=UPI0017829064|nr:polysaccharide biosynthesis C-terminal domain-containing protein [Lactobacillus johnsonii]MCT3342147.1 flippase [Lactobacillus johnsonii]QXL46998.1 polysaccharide biosynthesis C-terminal domain-containing protein [Lactobacillus johnsonii]
MKVIKNYFYNLSYQVLSLIVPLVTSAYVSRTLQPAGVGANAFTGSIIQYFVLLANMGIGYYANRQIAYVRENKEKLSQTFWEIQILKTLMTLAAYICFEIFMIFYTKQSGYMWAQSINLVAVAFDISWFYDGLENFKITVLKNSLVKLGSTAAIFIWIKGPNDVILYILILALSTLLGNLTLWPDVFKDTEYVKARFLNPWRHFLPMVELFIPQIAVQVYVQLNRTMLGVMVSEKASGYYQYSDNLVKLLISFATASGAVLLPHVANAVAHGDLKGVNRMLYKSFDFISAIAYPMTFGLAAISLTLAPKYYGPGYGPVGQAMMIESIIILMIAWSNAIGVQYLLPLNKNKEFTISVTLGAIVNIVLNFPFIELWGLNGAMVATVASEVSVTLYQLWVIRKIVNYKLLFWGTWKYLVSSILMFIVVFAMNRFVSNTWLMLLLEVSVGGIIYIGMAYLLKASVIDEIKDILVKRFKK